MVSKIASRAVIQSGYNLSGSLIALEAWDEARTLLSDELLPAARRSLGADHDLTLGLNQSLAQALKANPASTRDDLRFESTPTRATAASPRPAFDLDTGDDLFEADRIMQDVVQRRRRVFGPAHPETLRAEQEYALAVPR